MSEITSTGSYSVPLTTVLSDMQGTLKSIDTRVDGLDKRADKTDSILATLAENQNETKALTASVVQLTTRVVLLEERQPADAKERIKALEDAKPLKWPQKIGIWVSVVSGLTGTIGLVAVLAKLGG